MGNAHQTRNKDTYNGELVPNSSQPILFHSTHSASLQLSLTRRLVKRFDSCKGICFTSRPIDIGEKIFIRIVESSSAWKGALRFGFTSDDPASINASDLPKFACPDLTSENGYWAKAVPESIVRHGNVLFFYITEDGRVMLGVNGEEKGQLFGGVRTDILVWALMDVFGNTTAIEIVDVVVLPSPGLCSDETSRSLQSCSVLSTLSPPLLSMAHWCDGQHSSSSSSMHTSPCRASPPLVERSGVHTRGCSSLRSSLRAIASSRDQHRISESDINIALSSLAQPSTNRVLISDRRSSDRQIVEFIEPMQFHKTIGRNISLSEDKTIAMRFSQDYCNGYVFTSRPMLPGQKLIFSVLKVDCDFVGGLAFGMTACDPASIKKSDLPDDSDLLLDRPEYWVVHKDVYMKPAVNEELCFHLTQKGEVQFCRNGRLVGTLMHVDCSLLLWGFVDVYGSTQQIRSLGISKRPECSNCLRILFSSSAVEQSQNDRQSSTSPHCILPSRSTLTETSQISSSSGDMSRNTKSAKSGNMGMNQSSGVCDTALLSSSNILVSLSSTVCMNPSLSSRVDHHICGRSNSPTFRVACASSARGGLPTSNQVSARELAWGHHQHHHNCHLASSIAVENPCHHSFHCGGQGEDINESSFPNTASDNIQFMSKTQTYFKMCSCNARGIPRPGAARDDLLDDSLPALPPPLIPIPGAASASVIPCDELNIVSSITGSPYNLTSSNAEVLTSRLLSQSTNDLDFCNRIDVFNDRHELSKVFDNSSMFRVQSNLNCAGNSFGQISNDPLNFDSARSDALAIDSICSAFKTATAASSTPSLASSECSVCLERPADSALYTCGHMCMCYQCAQDIAKKPNPLCPICRQPIRDVIKIFRS